MARLAAPQGCCKGFNGFAHATDPLMLIVTRDWCASDRTSKRASERASERGPKNWIRASGILLVACCLLQNRFYEVKSIAKYNLALWVGFAKPPPTPQKHHKHQFKHHKTPPKHPLPPPPPQGTHTTRPQLPPTHTTRPQHHQSTGRSIGRGRWAGRPVC